MGSASYARLFGSVLVGWIIGPKTEAGVTGIGGGAKMERHQSIAFRGVGEVLARVKSFIVKAMEGGMKERKEFEKNA